MSEKVRPLETKETQEIKYRFKQGYIDRAEAIRLLIGADYSEKEAVMLVDGYLAEKAIESRRPKNAEKRRGKRK